MIHILNTKKKNMSRSASPLTLEYVLLGILTDRPIHGYEIYKELDRLEGIGLIWHIGQSKLYALLDKLEQQGWLGSRMVPGDSLPFRKEYNLTPSGAEAFQSWLSSPVAHGRDMRQDFLARLFFAQRSSEYQALDLLHLQQETCSTWLADMSLTLSRLRAEQKYERMVLRFRILQIEAMLKWLAECVQSV